MKGVLFLIPVLSTFACWLITYLIFKLLFFPLAPRKIFGFVVQGILPARGHEMADRLLKVISNQTNSAANPKQRLIDSTQLNFLLPQIESHIDDFLRHRLGKKMPMIGMFIGEQTIRQLKDIFMEELKEILPEVMQTYIDGVIQQDDFRKYVRDQLTKLDSSMWKSEVYPLISRDMRFIWLISGAVGFFVGIVQLLLVIFIYKP